MLTLASLLMLSMGSVWYGAASVWGAARWLRWVVLAPVVLLGGAARTGVARRVALPDVVLPLAVLVGYGLLLSGAAGTSALAFWKAVTFALTVFACLFGGANLVARFGRDRVLTAWRLVWRALLAWSVLSLATGRWGQAPEGLHGPAGNPNMFASILATTGLVLLSPAAVQRPGWLYLLEAGTGVALLLMTKGRASMAGVAAAVVVAVLLGRSARRWWVAGAVAALGALVFLATPDAAVGRMEDVLEITGGRSVFETRVGCWEGSWDAMEAGLPFGFGWGVKRDAPKAWTFDTGTIGYGREEGTSWLPIGEELGIPGFLLWTWIWWRLVRGAARAPAGLRPLAGGVLAFYFVLASFEGWLLSPGNWESWAFWTTIGILQARPAPAWRAPAPAALPAPEPLRVGA